MNKNIGKKFLSIVGIGIVVVGISLFNIGKNKVEVEDLEGKRSELGEVSILFQSNKGMYETDEIKIDKDRTSIDSMAKQGIDNFNLSKKNIDGREVLEDVSNGYADYTNALLEDEDKLASVSVTSGYDLDDNYHTYANIKIKYDDSDEVESYEISLGDQNIDGYSLIYSSVPISIDKDNMYIVTFGSYYSNEYIEQIESAQYEEYADDRFNKTVLNLYKVNLSSKSSKHILTKEYEGKEIYIKQSVCFANNKKAYFLVNEKDGEENYTHSLFEFDVFSKEINIIDLGIKENHTEENIRNFSVDDNKLLLITMEDVKNSESTRLDLRGTIVDLKNFKVKQIEDININTLYEEILQVRSINGKIYLITFETGGKKSEDTGYNSYYVTIFDENTNDLLYKGKIKQKTSYMTKVGIVKKDEL